jgi:hypothetical protein
MEELTVHGDEEDLVLHVEAFLFPPVLRDPILTISIFVITPSIFHDALEEAGPQTLGADGRAGVTKRRLHVVRLGLDKSGVFYHQRTVSQLCKE